MPIRSAIANDAQAIAEVHVQVWQAAFKGLLSAQYLAGLSVEKRKAMWAEAIGTDTPHVLVAEDAGKVVGFSALGPCREVGASPQEYEVWALHLTSSYWSTGMGRKLWLASREYLVEQGACSVSLWVIVPNSRAIKFYKAAGFDAVPNSLKRLELEGGWVEEVRYAQPLLHG